MTDRQRDRNLQMPCRDAQTRLERDWLAPNDTHLVEFAESIGAALESNPFGYPLRRLVTRRRNGVVREIWVMPSETQGIHVQVRVWLIDGSETEKTGCSVGKGVSRDWAELLPVLTRAWRRARDITRDRILRIAQGKETDWHPLVILGPELDDAHREFLRKRYRHERWKERVERKWLLPHDPGLRRFAERIGASIDYNRHRSPCRYLDLRLPSGLKGMIYITPNPDEGTQRVRSLRVGISPFREPSDDSARKATFVDEAVPNSWPALRKALNEAWRQLQLTIPATS